MAVAAAALSLGGCQRGGGGNAEPMNFKKLTNGKAVYRGEEAGLRHYAVTLWTNGHSTAAVDNYKDADISLALELVTAAREPRRKSLPESTSFRPMLRPALSLLRRRVR